MFKGPEKYIFLKIVTWKVDFIQEFVLKLKHEFPMLRISIYLKDLQLSGDIRGKRGSHL